MSPLAYRNSNTAKCGFAATWVFLFILIHSITCQAQQTVPSSMEDALHQMSDLAGIVFVGEVTAVRHQAGEQGASGIVEVDFRIDEAIRGCSTGTYTLREWSGLWQSSDQRYLPGQHLLMLLHSPNAAGITSPVNGMDGAIRIHAAGTSPVAPDLTASFAEAADLRWVAIRVMRKTSYSSSSNSFVTARVASASLISSASTEESSLPPQAPVPTITELLRSWGKHTP